MTEFRVWNDAPPLFLLSKTLAADCIAEHKHYSINGVEVSKEQFEIAHAATFKSKPLASSCSKKFWNELEGKTLAGHNLGGYSHNWVYLLETDQAKCSCGLTESAEVFEKTRGMKVNDLPFEKDTPTFGVITDPTSAIDWPRM